MKAAALKILLCLLISNLCAPLYLAQTAAETPQQNAEMLGENERLPFMPDEKTAVAPDSGSGGLLLRTLGAMLLIVGIIFFGAWGLKKFGFGGTSPNAVENAPELAILSSVSPGSGRTLSVVRFGERTLLIGSTAQSFTLLADESGGQINSPKTRSVADMLAEEDSSFEQEFAQAQANYDLRKENGGQIS